MASLKPLTPAEQSRVNYVKIRNTVKRLDSPVIRVHPDNAFLADEPDDAINQIPLRQQGQTFKCLVDRPDQAGDPGAIPGSIELTFDGTRIPSTIYRYMTPLDSLILEIEMTLPVGYTDRPGKHELGYYVVQGGNPSTSIPLEVNIDRSPPTLFWEPIVPDEVKLDGVTKKYLEDNGYVLVTVPGYSEEKIGDVVKGYYGDSIPLGVLIGTVLRTDTTTDVTFQLDAAVVTEKGDGLHAIFYQIDDRKGNSSAVSKSTVLSVVLTDPPEGLLPLSIPLFDGVGDGLVDLEDAQTPLGVGIDDEYTNYEEGDELVVTFDGILQASQIIPSFPWYVNVLFKDVFNGDPGPKTVVASYQIKRGSTRYPATPISKNVEVDLRKPGQPIDPDEPGSPNPNLALVTVQGSSGGTVNTLREADKDDDVTVTVTIYTGAKEDDTVQLQYAGTLVSDADGGVITIPAIPPTSLVWTVDWSVFDAAGNGDPTLPMIYNIGHPLNDNLDISRPREVDVLIQDETVPDPVFQNLWDDPFYPDWMICSSLRRDPVQGVVLEVLVPGGELALANQELTFSYQGYTDAAGSIPKPGTDLDVLYTPTPQEAADGFIVKIPYQPFLATLNAWGGVKYTAVINGRPIPSREHLVKVYLTDPNGDFCELPT